MAVTLKDIKAIEFPGGITFRKHPTEDTLQITGAGVTTITQTDSTADATLDADTVTSISAAVPSITDYTAHGSGATTVTSSAATDLDTTAAALATLENEVTSLATWATEVDLDLEALIVDVRDLKSCFNSVVDALQLRGILG